MLALLLLALALLLWVLAQRARRLTGLPRGRVVYADTQGWGRLDRPLYSQALRLTGKPDYLVRQGASYLPVEVKSGRAPADGPHAAHIYQLAAYCALVAEAYGRRPGHGLIQYADATWSVDFTPALEADLRRLLDQMRADETAPDVPRSHASAARCRGCGYREGCEEALV